jgi:demethylmenaquinone methyltransferase/2-methoxy-6-polyprenyl-1,4-benzoquinol methylase
MPPPPIALREKLREKRFNGVWTEELNRVFADVAPYYDQANVVASLGMWDYLLRSFMDTMQLSAGERVLDVCAGTNAVGIALLKREPTLEVHAIDRSAEMQEVGQRRAAALGMKIHSVIDDVHKLPFPDNHFDVVTLQWATRHLRVRQVFGEIRRVLKPGGRFYHCDMLRPANPLVEVAYYTYLRFCLNFTALLFGSGASAHGLKRYFIQALEMFYSADELSDVLSELGFERVRARTVLAGMIGFHRACKPGAS